MVTRADAPDAVEFHETAELTDRSPGGKRLTIPMIGMANNADQAVAASDVMLLPKAQEACPMGLAPTTSTTMMRALGDALAVALMERRGFSADQYRDFHPGGSLGKKLIRVSDIMHQGAELPLVSPETPMREVLIIMTSGQFGFAGHAGVIDARGALIGIITDGDLRRHMDPGLLDRKARGVLTQKPKTVPPEMLAAEALTVMNAKPPKVTHLFVVDPRAEIGRPLGFLGADDILRAGLT